jgi:uncharacterized membrane protein
VTRIEADMQHTTISGHHWTHHAVAAFWALVGAIVVIAFADALSVLAIAFAIVATVWWVYRSVEHLLARDDAEMAPVTHLRSASSGERVLPSSQGPRAA